MYDLHVAARGTVEMWDAVDVDLLVLQPAVFVLQVTQVHLCNRGDESTGRALHLFTFRQN